MNIIQQLNEIDAIKHGTFTLKSGEISNLYVDLRLTISYPHVIRNITHALWNKVQHLDFDIICGVPYTALPFASGISIEENVPMVMRRKEAKNHGTKKMIEGVFKRGQKCLIVEDLITSGTSILETKADLEAVGLVVTDAVFVLDRQQGGREKLLEAGVTPHSLFTLSDLLENKHPPSLTYGARAPLAHNPMAKKLFETMESKKSNLSFNPDVTTQAELLGLADLVGPYICMLKTHIDILTDFDDALPAKLQALADKHNFVIFEDRKFADIGSVVKSQYSEGPYKIADWADITTVHMVPGPGIIEGLKQVGGPKNRGILLLAEMSSQGTLAQGPYTLSTVQEAQNHKEFVAGFISMGKLTDDPGFVHITPGVKLQKGTDNLGQQFKTPAYVITECGSDIIQVGRGIYQAEDPKKAAREYRDAAWSAYQARL